MKFYGKVDENKLRLYEQDKFEKHYKSLNGHPICLQLDEGSKRSNAQNDYWWAVIVQAFVQAMGYPNTDKSRKQVHELLKLELNSETIEYVNPRTGEIEMKTIPKSTANLNKKEFSELKERAQQLGAEFYNIVIPDPVKAK